jgi:hypothetical protein
VCVVESEHATSASPHARPASLGPIADSNTRQAGRELDSDIAARGFRYPASRGTVGQLRTLFVGADVCGNGGNPTTQWPGR